MPRPTHRPPDDVTYVMQMIRTAQLFIVLLFVVLSVVKVLEREWIGLVFYSLGAVAFVLHARASSRRLAARHARLSQTRSER